MFKHLINIVWFMKWPAHHIQANLYIKMLKSKSPTHLTPLSGSNVSQIEEALPFDILHHKNLLKIRYKCGIHSFHIKLKNILKHEEVC